MTRPWFAASIAILGLGSLFPALSHKSADVLNPVEGVRINSRLACDGATNPQEDMVFHTTFSPGKSERSFHLDVFQAKYCRRVDLYFICVFHGHDRWRHEWSATSLDSPPPVRVYLNSCSAHESADAPQYILSGWYREGGDRKAPWKQGKIAQVSQKPEVYEFTDPEGGTARLEITRP